MEGVWGTERLLEATNGIALLVFFWTVFGCKNEAFGFDRIRKTVW